MSYSYFIYVNNRTNDLNKFTTHLQAFLNVKSNMFPHCVSDFYQFTIIPATYQPSLYCYTIIFFSKHMAKFS